MSGIDLVPQIIQLVLGIVGGGVLGTWLTHKRLGPKSTAEARDITAAAIDKDWNRFQREIDRLVKRVEQSEEAAKEAIAGQHACENREIELKARITQLEAVNAARGEIRARATEIVAADRAADRALSAEKGNMQ